MFVVVRCLVLEFVIVVQHFTRIIMFEIMQSTIMHVAVILTKPCTTTTTHPHVFLTTTTGVRGPRAPNRVANPNDQNPFNVHIF